jgi:glycosyltransferase involved in cell wall biosynthesis
LIFKIPYIISLRGSDVPFYNPRFSKLDHWLFAPLNKHLIWSNAAEVISNSQWLKKLAQKTAPEQKIITIPNGVDTSQFKPLKGNQQESNAFNIICVSRLVKRKRIDLVIKAVAALENKDLKLTIIGTGKEKHSLSSLVDKLGVNNQVVFLHNVAHHKIVEHYQQSDLFVLPSLSEGMSNSLLEALSCGLPVIVSQTGGVKELVKENGIVLKTATPGSLKKAIVDLYQNKEKQKRMGRASRKIAKQYSWGKSADQYLKIYQNYFSA